mgnify:CR=1 FL=1
MASIDFKNCSEAGVVESTEFLFKLCCHGPGFAACEKCVDWQVEKDQEGL